MRVKAGVELGASHWTKNFMDAAVEKALREICEGTITSGTDGKHGVNSLHYKNRARDYRTKFLAPETQVAFRNRVKDILGPHYDVVLEPDHLHVEFDPKGPVE